MKRVQLFGFVILLLTVHIIHYSFGMDSGKVGNPDEKIKSIKMIVGENFSKGHNFSDKKWSNGLDNCSICHIPNNSNASINAPIHNPKIQITSFIPYSSPTMDATPDQPSGISKLCLSCHDGTIASDNYAVVSGTNNLGTDLSNDHPISFKYNSSLALIDGGLHDPSTTASGLGGTINSDLLINGSMECSSCHDVHSMNGNGLLVMSNTGSKLCLTCHDK